jgi:hypothetical protein
MDIILHWLQERMCIHINKTSPSWTEKDNPLKKFLPKIPKKAGG